MAQKLKIPKSLMSELTAEVLIEEGLYADIEEKIGGMLWKWWYSTTPEEVADRARKLSDEDLLIIRDKFWRMSDYGGPNLIQQKAIENEIKKRGLKENKKINSVRKVNEDFEAEVQTQAQEPENAPISDRETLALKAGAIKDGVETWFKEFKVDRDTIQLMHGNKARVSDGSGNSYIITFKVNSWNPPAVELKSLELVNISEFDDSTNIE